MPGATVEKISAFKELCLAAMEQVSGGKAGYGILCDNRLGKSALHKAAGKGIWIGRPVEWPGSRPLRLEPELGPDFGGLSEWPLEHVVKVLCFYHPDDDAETKARQEDTVLRLFHACRRNRLEMLLEIIPSKVGPVGVDTNAKLINRIYDLGIYPDWWKLEPLQSAEAWRVTCAAIEARDSHVQGVVVLIGVSLMLMTFPAVRQIGTSLLASAGIAGAVVTNDSGLMHLLSAAKTPLIALFLSTVEEFGFFPLSAEAEVLSARNIECRPCNHKGLAACPKKHFRCARELTADQVYGAVARHLQ